MNFQGSIVPFKYFTSRFFLFGIAAFLILSLPVIEDWLESQFQHSSFYIYESVLFNVFWWIFLPFIWAQFKCVHRTECKGGIKWMLFSTVPVLLHLLFFPAIVWLISSVFYYHTFSYQQTLKYAISNYLSILLVLYIVPIFIFYYIEKGIKATRFEEYHTVIEKEFSSLKVFMVTEGNRRMSIPAEDIIYFSASSPYINIHVSGRKFLFNETLKSVLHQLDSREFLRIHKSTIINIRMVQSFKSRQNGDYDITMCDGSVLRLSRNFARDFKLRYCH